MKTIKGGVTAAQGFKANGLASGIKRSGKTDLALIYSEQPAITAGVFTKSSIKAAPLIVTMQHLRKNVSRAILVNSGNANCFTGNFGLIYARRSTELIAKLLGLKATHVLVASTGIIGKPLPYQKIVAAAPALTQGLNHNKGHLAAQGIMTTDLVAKECAVEININDKKVRIGGCAKGSGMIAPNMATMLGFITTDADISAPMLKQALTAANELSFNNITVDGCMSTNDMVTVMANGRSGNRKITTKGKDFQKFLEALTYVCLDLAKKIVLDGEGATKFVEITVLGSPSVKIAKQAAMAIANSPLVKTALFGSDPNWGRVAAAVGSLGIAKVTEKNLKIKFSSFAKTEIRIGVDLNLGSHAATVFTCDLSYAYVKINGQYN